MQNVVHPFFKVWVKQCALFGGTHTGFLEGITFNTLISQKKLPKL